MNIKSEFGRFHPVVQFVYFTSVIFFAMFIREPVFVGISLVFSLAYSVHLGEKRALKAVFWFIVPMFVLIAVINPLFNHAGVTIWFYLPDGNPFTMESLVYGIVSGGLFSCTMLWCICLRYIMTSDKVIYLFGRVAPKLSLLISMILIGNTHGCTSFIALIVTMKCMQHSARSSHHTFGIMEINASTVNTFMIWRSLSFMRSI